MKLLAYRKSNDEEKLGLYYNGSIFPLDTNAKSMGIDCPQTMKAFLAHFQHTVKNARYVESEAKKGNLKWVENRNTITVLPPVPKPESCRNIHGFKQHEAIVRQYCGVDLKPEYDHFPVFYYANHRSIIGEGDVFVEKDYFEKLDFGLEAAIIIGKHGRNIKRSEAEKHIAGITIMNDFSARHLQIDEMKLSFGPAKSKDFATAIGPWLVTLDELEPHKINTSTGYKYDIHMRAYYNGENVSEGNLKDMDWTFAEIIEYISYGAELQPGDIIGTGTVSTGCFLDLNEIRATVAREIGEPFTPTWLNPGDIIELEIEELGKLKNRIVSTENDYSILR